MSRPAAGELQGSPLERERGGGGARVGGEAEALRGPRPVRRPVDAVGRHVGRVMERELQDLEVARPREGAHQEPQERDQDQQQGQHEPDEDPKLGARARRRRDAPHHRLDLLQPLVGRHAVDELPEQQTVVLEERRQGLGERGGGGSVRGPDHVEDEAGGLLAVPPRHLSHGVADQHDVERDPHVAQQLDGLAHRVRAHVPAPRHVRPVLGVGVRDRVGEQHHSEVGAARVARRELLGLQEGVVEVGPLPVVAVAGDVVHRDLVPRPEQDQPVAVALEEGEHLLEGGHALLVGVQRGERGGVVHEEQDHGAHARGRRGGGAFARQCGTRLEREGEQGEQHADP